MIKKLFVSELIMDYNFYPRHKIDDANVSSMREALRAGVELPPIQVDRKSKRIIDGFHRVAAVRKEFGDTAKIEVELIDCPDDKTLLLESIRRNASHGQKLYSYDKTRCILLAEDLKILPDEIAAALSLTVEKVGELRVKRTAMYEEHPMPIKRSLSHLAGKRLSEGQRQANKTAGGMRVMFFINQVISALEGDIVNWDDPHYAERLMYLRDAIDDANKKLALA